MIPLKTSKSSPICDVGSIPYQVIPTHGEDSRDTPGQNAITPWGFELWQHLHQEHGLTLTESEMQEIVRLAEPLTGLYADNAELIERLRDRTDSYLAAAARHVQTIQQQSVLIQRLHRAISARMCADDPTGEERLELLRAWEQAGAYLNQKGAPSA